MVPTCEMSSSLSSLTFFTSLRKFTFYSLFKEMSSSSSLWSFFTFLIIVTIFCSWCYPRFTHLAKDLDNYAAKAEIWPIICSKLENCRGTLIQNLTHYWRVMGGIIATKQNLQQRRVGSLSSCCPASGRAHMQKTNMQTWSHIGVPKIVNLQCREIYRNASCVFCSM